jgi:hypothetical protein
MILDPDELDAAHIYKLLIATVVPRAIGWISTLSTDGVANLAPFPFFTVVGRKPPVLSVTFQHRSDGVTLKDTYVNIRDTGDSSQILSRCPLLKTCTDRRLSTHRRSTSSKPLALRKHPA